MLKECNAMATLAVRDIAAARKFYCDTLGLEPAQEEPQMLALRSGASTVLVYESAHAGTNRANAATWEVTGDLAALVQDLKSRGVRFEHYDLLGTRLDGDLHIQGARQVAWCKDPDGNILCLAHG
ncbi:MAG TPA: VOC family protein [Ramlibacter sp.]|nr:VOC family protein [Ramlibacter sp.]